MGDKVRAIQTMKAAGVPTVPGSEGVLGDDMDEIVRLAEEIGLPVIVKAVGGGGGRGMRVAHLSAELSGLIPLTRGEAEAAFGDPRLYMEKFLTHPRHVEIQVLADAHGNAIHLGERDCSMQRRHQKVIEEAPAPGITPRNASASGACARTPAWRWGTEGPELSSSCTRTASLFHRDEYPPAGGAPGHGNDYRPGHRPGAAADRRRRAARRPPGGCPAQRPCHRVPHQRGTSETFAPSPGDVALWHAPGGPGVRVDSHLYTGYTVPPFYDSLVGKLIAWGEAATPPSRACAWRWMKSSPRAW